MPKTSPRQLNKAPIVEAILELDCELSPSLEIDDLESGSLLAYSEDYPHKTDQLLYKGTITAADTEADISGKSQICGFQFSAADRLQVVQARRTGFSFNRLAPYSNLSDYLPEIGCRWNQYVEFAKPIVLSRVGLRYVNVINLPIDQQVDLANYFSGLPEKFPYENLRLGGFFQSMNLASDDPVAVCQVSLATQNVENNCLPIVVDLSVSSPQNLPPKPFDELVETIEGLRAVKNNLFFDSLTEQCLNLFQ